jgi:hypothetical protein
MPINRALDTYRSFTDILRIIKVSKDSNLIRAALACESNMDILSEEPPINSKNPSTIPDWWGYLLNFAHENPLINFASDLFSLKLFKKHFEEANTRSFGNLVMVIKMDKPNQVSYKNLFMLPNTVTCFFQQGPTTITKNGIFGDFTLPPLVGFRKAFPHFQAFVVDKNFKIKKLPSHYRDPTGAHRARTLAQINIIEDMVMERRERIGHLTFEEHIFLEFAPTLIKVLKEDLDDVYSLSFEVLQKLMATPHKSLTTKQLQEADNRMTRAAARNMAARFNKAVFGDAITLVNTKARLIQDSTEAFTENFLGFYKLKTQAAFERKEEMPTPPEMPLEPREIEELKALENASPRPRKKLTRIPTAQERSQSNA